MHYRASLPGFAPACGQHAAEGPPLPHPLPTPVTASDSTAALYAPARSPAAAPGPRRHPPVRQPERQQRRGARAHDCEQRRARLGGRQVAAGRRRAQEGHLGPQDARPAAGGAAAAAAVPPPPGAGLKTSADRKPSGVRMLDLRDRVFEGGAGRSPGAGGRLVTPAACVYEHPAAPGSLRGPPSLSARNAPTPGPQIKHTAPGANILILIFAPPPSPHLLMVEGA